MAKYVAPGVEDASLSAIALATEMYFCDGQPATRAAAIAATSVAAITMAAGDFVLGNGAAGVRTLTIGAKAAASTVNQNTDHVALCSGTTLLYVTTLAAPVQVSVGGQYSNPAMTVSSGPIV